MGAKLAKFRGLRAIQFYDFVLLGIDSTIPILG